MAQSKNDYLTISLEAKNKLSEIISMQNNQDKIFGIRVTVRTRGCSGLSYKIEFATDNNITKFDDIITLDSKMNNGKNISIFIDPKISLFLIGSEMIYKENDIESGFDFINPNENSRCGCGESFNI